MMVGVAVLMMVMMIQGISTRIFERLFTGVRRSLVSTKHIICHFSCILLSRALEGSNFIYFASSAI